MPRRLNVLIVDDDGPTCRAMRMLVGLAGHDAVEAQTADWACQLIRRHPFDVAIVDWNLGGARSGSEVVEHAFQRGIRCFLASGFSREHIMGQWLAHNPLAGVIEFMPKPLHLEDEDGEEGVRTRLARVVQLVDERDARSLEDTPPRGTPRP